MERTALGLIETVGMAAAFEAADAAVKSANVALIGYELSKGGGMVTIRLEGDVGAVNAAVQAGCAAASLVNRVYSSKVIPRPHTEIKPMIASAETVGASRQASKTTETAGSEIEAELTAAGSVKEAEESTEEPAAETKDTEETPAEEPVEPAQEAMLFPVADETDAGDEKKKSATCNLCGDISCTRVKGDLKTKCIHYFNN